MKFRNLLTLGAALFAAAVFGAEAPKVENYAGKQIELCMIGDSITWAMEGDYFRKHLLENMPELAFVGTHTAKFGYSHAGEGGNSTGKVLERINNPDSIPNARNYHLLIGVNDNAGAKSAEATAERGKKTLESIVKIVHELEKRPGVEKIFLGTILPCSVDGKPESDAFQFRDMSGVETNKLMRADFNKLFPSGKVVLVEYEKPLRPLPNVRQIIRLHPTPEGYVPVAKILADTLKANTTAPKPDPAVTKYGVEVRNLWSIKNNCTAPLIPGWYMVSFNVKKVTGDKLNLLVESRFPASLKTPFKKDFSVPAKAGERVEFEVFTGYQGYGYDQSSLEIKPANGEIERVLVEKMRPGKKASIYGEGTYVDAKSPLSLGEKLIPAK